MPEEVKKTAFVFAGGGSLGSIQVGMLRALAGKGITADMVVGSSVGALNAAYYAGTPTAEGVERLAKIWLSLRRYDVFPISWRTMLAFLLRREFLVPADGVRWLVDTYVPYRNLEDAKLPVHVVATDLLSGGPVVLSKGSASQAIIASTAIPAAFAPVILDRRYLADGAITCNAPDIDFYVAPPLCPLLNSPIDFAVTGELIERAAASTNAWIADGGLTRREIPHQMNTHKHA